MTATCVECLRPSCQIQARGCCSRCYRRLIRRGEVERHPTVAKTATVEKREKCRKNAKRYFDHEPTMAELDALIAERLPTMPPGE